jgi:16S rRNA (guanine527-N7)-methyltransferase
MDLIHKYFPDLSKDQQNKFSALSLLYNDWNSKINLISRKDMMHFYERHVLHSLAIAKFIQFPSGSIIADVGTGGGFPGIPLSIAFPKSSFILIDSIAKKIKAVNEISRALNLSNVETITERAEKLNIKCNYIVSRAVSALPEFYKNTSHLLKKNENFGNGIIYLKGGDLNEELKGMSQQVKQISISDYFEETFFESKKVVFITV